MAAHQRLQSYLDTHKIPYQVVNHSLSYTSRQAAESLHVSPDTFAKVVVFKADQRYLMAVLPSRWKVDLKRLEHVLNCQHVRLATENELDILFSDCEIGSMPPFGNLYDTPVYVDATLTRDEEIVFDAGSHANAIKMRYRDFSELVRPQVAEFHYEPSKVDC